MKHKIKLSGPATEDDYPCLLCPFCSSEDVQITSAPEQTTHEGGVVETAIGFGCLVGHSWAWVLADWEGRIFFSVRARKQSRGLSDRTLTDADIY
jgi:hypothetical protein